MKICNINRNGKERKILILDEEEKMIRRQIKEELSESISLPDCVYSFAKGKSAKAAASYINLNIDRYRYFIKCDIEKYYESIKVEKIMTLLREKSDNIDVINQIKIVLEEEIQKCGVQGLSIGSPLSNILSNIYLIDFDNYFNSREDIIYVRFCDDMFFLCNKNIIEEVKEKLSSFGLKINSEKTVIGSFGDSIKFVGFEITKKVNHFYEEFSKIIYSSDVNEYISFLYSIKNKDLSVCDFDIISDEIKQKTKLLYHILFDYIVLDKSKDDITEELMTDGEYKTAYEFEEVLKNSMQNIFGNSFLQDICSVRSGEYYVSSVNSKKDYVKIAEYIDNEVLEKHIKGEISIAVRLDRRDGRSKFIIVDIDRENIKEAEDAAKRINNYLSSININSYIEYSGMKGYHLWTVFQEYIELKDLNEFIENAVVKSDISLSNIEIIPKYNALTETQNIIKLPLGIHPETRERCRFIDIDNVDEIEENPFPLNNEEVIKKYFDEIRDKYPNSMQIIDKCVVIRNILEKAFAANQLSHFQRLIILYIFFYLEEGREFIHYVIGKFENYSYNITESHINNAPEKPISCKRIREYLKGEEILSSCCCNFSKSEGVYNTPLLHSEDKNFGIISVKANAKEIFDEIVKLKKDKDEIDKKINELNKKLTVIFDSIGADEIDIPMGTLKKLDGNKGWAIYIKL